MIGIVVKKRLLTKHAVLLADVCATSSVLILLTPLFLFPCFTKKKIAMETRDDHEMTRGTSTNLNY